MQASQSKPPVALVTGGSRGIGAAICRELARSGAAVFVAARTQASCEGLAEEIRAAGGQAWPLELDVADPASIERATQEAQRLSADLGGVDWLVNNAGIAESAPLTADGDIYARHMRINFEGPRRMVEALLPSLKASARGRVVNIASSAGLRGYGYVAAYCASKFALVGYTLSAALELARSGPSFNAVCPHYVDSPMLTVSIQRLVELTGKTPDEARAFFQAENPGGELVAPSQVAAAVRALLEGDANGRLVELDGSPEPKFLHPNQAPSK